MPEPNDAPPITQPLAEFYHDNALQCERDLAVALKAVKATQRQLDAARGRLEVTRQALTGITHLICLSHECFYERQHRHVAKVALMRVRGPANG